jgi:hypothetical protein
MIQPLLDLLGYKHIPSELSTVFLTRVTLAVEALRCHLTGSTRHGQIITTVLQVHIGLFSATEKETVIPCNHPGLGKVIITS